jgi:hypothetical protein
MKWRGGRSRVSRDRHKHLLCHIQARVNVGSFVAASSRGRPVQSEWRLRAVDSMGQGLTKQGPRRMGNPFIPPAVSQGQTELRTSDRDYSQSPSSGVIDAAAGSTGGIPGLGGASGSVARCTRPPTFGGSAHPTRSLCNAASTRCEYPMAMQARGLESNGRETEVAEGPACKRKSHKSLAMVAIACGDVQTHPSRSKGYRRSAALADADEALF